MARDARLVRIVRRATGVRGDLAAGPGCAAVSPGHRRARDRESRLRQRGSGPRCIRNFNADGFDSLYPRYKGNYPLKFTLGQRREIKKLVKSKPAERDVPSSA